MSLQEGLKVFSDLHDKARNGALRECEQGDYLGARDELARALLAVQHVQLQPDQVPRHALRVARALQVDMEFFDGLVRGITRNVSAGGFSALLARPPRVEDAIKVTLRIPGGEPLSASARVAEVKVQPGNALASFQFMELSKVDLERLEMFIFDSVLAQLRK